MTWANELGKILWLWKEKSDVAVKFCYICDITKHEKENQCLLNDLWFSIAFDHWKSINCKFRNRFHSVFYDNNRKLLICFNNWNKFYFLSSLMTINLFLCIWFHSSSLWICFVACFRSKVSYSHFFGWFLLKSHLLTHASISQLLSNIRFFVFLFKANNNKMHTQL